MVKRSFVSLMVIGRGTAGITGVGTGVLTVGTAVITGVGGAVGSWVTGVGTGVATGEGWFAGWEHPPANRSAIRARAVNTRRKDFIPSFYYFTI
jgi:hypothetical protein